LGRLHESRGDCLAARNCYEDALGHWQAGGHRAGVGAALNQLGNLLSNNGSPAEALRYYQDCLVIDDELGDNAGRARRSINIGVALQQLGRWEDAVESFYRALALIESHHLPEQRGYVLLGLGDVFLTRNNPAKAISMLTAVVSPEQPGDSTPDAARYALNMLSRAYLRLGDQAKTAEAIERATALARAGGDQRDLALAMVNRAELALAQGDPVCAAQSAQTAVELTAAAGLRPDESEAWRLKALAAVVSGDYGEARADFERATDLLADMEESFELARVRLHHGRFLLSQGAPVPALSLLKAAARVFRALGVVAESLEANRLLFRHELSIDRDMALLSGVSGLATLGLAPSVFVEQALDLLREGLAYESAAVVVAGRVLSRVGVPDVGQALAVAGAAGVVVSDTALSWPMSFGGVAVGRVYLDRSRPMPTSHSDLVLETVASLLANAVRASSEILVQAPVEREGVAELRYRGVAGRNARMAACLETVRHVAATAVPVLILGESGTGKELVARALHETGPRAGKPFVAVNCAALPESLLEAEFFGIEKGVATGVNARKGRFEGADGGTVFLDEIADMSAALQAKLLRVLEEHRFERVGGRESIPADVRVIAATNRDLCTLMSAGQFRPDLYYRLNAVELRLPPLRERTADIPELVRYFLVRSSQEFGRNVTEVSPAALSALIAHSWPGNIRELEHVVERAVLLSRSSTIAVEDLPVAVRSGSTAEPQTSARSRLRLLRDEARDAAGADVERRILVESLESTHWNVQAAAVQAGFSRAQFYRLLHKHGLSRPKS
jgi:DNA-binding NtrC family response regulator/tetratricopeptide (TPR) repeat protein